MLGYAHPGHGVDDFGSGLSHPLNGLDHILAMLAVGLWAVQAGGLALWCLPLAFVSSMVAGGLAGRTHLPLPMVEHGIFASVVILGALLASATRLDLGLSASIVGFFGLFHGYAHGAEMPDSAGALSYGSGFVLAAMLLHGVGIGGALIVERFARMPWLRFAGAGLALAGFLLFIA
jgi:urease accessory protein